MNLENIFYLLIVAILWGCTNPFLKRGSKGIRTIQNSNIIIKTILEFWFLFSRWQYLFPFLINIGGSVLFYYSLANIEISLVVPITNSMTFLFTTLISILLGEEGINKNIFIGMLFVILGVGICMV
eukprot:TRINITY_DN1019_c0_g1_i1.p1 TRINITY_DN1019_c0_g1~~TRINITY_DN1019_c0_g1_i1.p1  ORF type:complete len:126 (+),score=1.83 TRINITY_DN1019_c0_g1_i1:120-497(+)